MTTTPAALYAARMSLPRLADVIAVVSLAAVALFTTPAQAASRCKDRVAALKALSARLEPELGSWNRGPVRLSLGSSLPSRKLDSLPEWKTRGLRLTANIDDTFEQDSEPAFARDSPRPAQIAARCLSGEPVSGPLSAPMRPVAGFSARRQGRRMCSGAGAAVVNGGNIGEGRGSSETIAGAIMFAWRAKTFRS